MELRTNPHDFVVAFERARIVLKSDAEAEAIALGTCPFSHDTMVDMLDHDGIAQAYGDHKEEIASVVELAQKAGAFDDMHNTMFVKSSFAVLGKAVDGETDDQALIIDFSETEHQTTIDINCDLLDDALVQEINNFHLGTMEIDSIDCVTIFDGKVRTMECTRSINAANLESREIEDLLDELDLMAATVVIDVHKSLEDDLQTATLSLIENCPDTGRSLRSICASRMLKGPDGPINISTGIN